MKQGIWRLKKVMSICTLFIFASCDKKEGDVRAEILPEGPVVIDAKYEYNSPLDGETITVSPPWFSFALKAKNYNRDKRVSIISVTLQIRGTKNGAPTEAKAGFTGIGFSNGDPFYDTNCDGSVNGAGDKVGSLFELDPGVGCVSNVTLYAGSLPEDDDFKFDVEATFVGWYNRFDSGAFVPDERLEIKSAFSTR
jgi:hypothetical protein